MPNKGSAIYSKGYVKNLYLSGLAAQLTFGANNQREKTDEKIQFHQHIATEIENNNNLVNEIKFDSDGALLDLFKHLCFIQVWSDFKETWDDDAARRQMKFKKDINKLKRKLIHAGLFKAVYEILLQFKLAETAEKIEIERLINKLVQYDERKKTLINVTKQVLEYKRFTLDVENDSEESKRIIDESFS